MVERMKKTISLAIAMLIVMATIAVPVAMADTGTPGSTQSTCTTCSAQTIGSSCGCSGGCSSNSSNVTAVQVNGSEAHMAIAQALRNTTVKSLMRELIERGYIPEINNAVYYKLSPANESTLVAIPFKKHDDSQDVESQDDGSRHNGSTDEALIVYRKTGESVFVRAMIKQDKATTVLQDGAIYTYGLGSVLVKPIEILRANETYQNLKIDLAAQGFLMNEANATVIINESSNIATISIIAEGQNSSKISYATVDLNKEIVTSITDPDWWTCLQCCGVCIATGITLCPFCAGVCVGCVTLIACPLCLACFSACGIILIGSCYCCACQCAGVGCPP